MVNKNFPFMKIIFKKFKVNFKMTDKITKEGLTNV